MIRRSSIAAALAVLALPTLGLATAAWAGPHRHGHAHHGHHHHVGGHPHGHPRPGGPPHRGRHHSHGPRRHRPRGGLRHGFRPRFGHGFGSGVILPDGGPRSVLGEAPRVLVRRYPVFVEGGYRASPTGGCTTRRSASLTPYGWHRIVTVRTCVRP